jgi:hypothetical protein
MFRCPRNRGNSNSSRLGGITPGVHPAQALLDLVAETAANVAILRELVAELEPLAAEVETIRGPQGASACRQKGAPALYGANHRGDGAPHVLVGMYAEERERLAKFSRDAVASEATERLVAMEQAQGQLAAALVMRVLEHPSMGLSLEQVTAGRTAVAKELRLLAASEDTLE